LSKRSQDVELRSGQAYLFVSDEHLTPPNVDRKGPEHLLAERVAAVVHELILRYYVVQ
jgi:hypothetical protein